MEEGYRFEAEFPSLPLEESIEDRLGSIVDGLESIVDGPAAIIKRPGSVDDCRKSIASGPESVQG